MAYTRPSLLHLVIAMCLVLPLTMFSPAAEGQQAVDGPQCVTGMLIDNQCRIEVDPIGEPTRCPTFADPDSSPGNCFRTVQWVYNCPDGSTGSGGRCSRTVERVAGAPACPADYAVIDGPNCERSYVSTSRSFSCPEDTEPGTNGTQQVCWRDVGPRPTFCPSPAIGEAPDCYMLEPTICSEGQVLTANRHCIEPVAEVIGTDTRCPIETELDGDICNIFVRDPNEPCPADTAMFVIRSFDGAEICIVGRFTLNPGGLTCPTEIGVYSDVYGPCARFFAIECLPGAVLSAERECRRPVDALPGDCPAGLFTFPTRCLELVEGTLTPDCEPGDMFRDGFCRNTIPAQTPLVCPPETTFESIDGQCLVEFTVERECPTGLTLPGDENRCIEPLDDIPGFVDCPAGFTLVADRCERFEPVVYLCASRVVTINMQLGDAGVGTSGSDVILGTEGGDIIRGRGGDDWICSLGGDDDIRGGGGNDQIFGGAGHDVVRGNAGDDVLHGGDGDDRVLGGKDNDRLSGNAGDDLVKGGAGDDQLRGNDGNDVCAGNAGTDTDWDGSCERLRTTELAF